MITNAQIAELLAAEAEQAKHPIQRALRKAGRSAFLWPVEAAELLEQGGRLTDLFGVGPFIARLLQSWIEKPPRPTRPPPIRKSFLTWTEAQQMLG